MFPAVFSSFGYDVFAPVSRQQVLAWGSAALLESVSRALEGGWDPVG